MRRSRSRSRFNGGFAGFKWARSRQALAHDGWQVVRQRGSHVVLVKTGNLATLSVPDHREVAKGTLRSLIRASGLTVDEFVVLSRR